MKEGDFYWRYFRVSDPDFNQKMQDFKIQRDAVADQWEAVRRSFGADGVKTWAHSGEYAGFVFDTPPDNSADTYRKVGELWVPKRTTTSGKAIWKLINAVPKVKAYNSVLADYGLTWDVPMMIDMGEGKFASVSGFYEPGIWFVKVPSRHIDDASLEAMKAVAGEVTTPVYKSALWQPPAAWVQVKNWEFVREWDELEEKYS